MAFSGDGSTKCFVGGDWAAFEGKRAFSVGWTSNVTDSNAYPTVLAKWNLFVTYAFWIGYDCSSTNTKWAMYALSGAYYCGYTATDSGAIGNQHSYVATYDGSRSNTNRWKIWKDGAALSVTVLSDTDITTPNIATNVTLGGAYASNALYAGYGWSGLLQDVRYWDTALSDADAAFWADPRCRSGVWGPTGPTAYWSLGGFNGNNAYDYGPTTAYDLTATNSPVFAESMRSLCVPSMQVLRLSPAETTNINATAGAVVVEPLASTVHVGTTVACTLAEISVESYAAAVISAVGVNCTAGAVTVAPLGATVLGNTTIHCSTAEVSVASNAAGMSVGTTFDCTAGTVAVEALAADVVPYLGIPCTLGTVAVAPLNAEVLGNTTIVCTASSVAVAPLPASVVSSFEISATIAAIVVQAFAATVDLTIGGDVFHSAVFHSSIFN